MPNTIIYANILPIIGLLSLMIFMLSNPLFDKKQNKLFFVSSLVIVFMIIVVSIDYTVSLMEFDKAWVIRRIASFLNFSFSCIVPIFLIRIFINKKMNPIMYLPAVINWIICAASIFTNLVFFFPKDGGYQRGPLFILPFLITIIYLVLLLIASLKEREKRALEALFLLVTVLSISFSLYLEIAHRFKFLSWDFSAIFLILYYLLLNINRSKIDALTGANNRAVYVQKIKSLNQSRNCIIAMIDINDFKSINDTLGHDTGDNILIEFVEITKSFLDNKNTLYRIGGDEFVIIAEKDSMEKFKKRIDDCMIELGKKKIYCAIGIAEYDFSADIEDIIRIADEKMYEDKRNYYFEK